MRPALNKPHLRLAAVDDGPFTRRQKYAPLVAVVVSLPATLEAIAVDRVRIDGTDANDRILALLRGLPQLPGIRTLLVDGIAVGGFNVLDLGRLHRELGVPVISVTRRTPDFPAIQAALRTYFPRDARRRFSLIRAHRLRRIATGGVSIWAATVGLTAEEAAAVVRRAAVQGYWPEPLRLAHLVARAVGRAARTKD
ncbi:MAG: DUF99 family protein [Thermoplasmata archaeon]|nr:DUF99 family protein [Thermoplasmata archaeon]